jgi:DNA helicase MCM8
MPPQSATTGLSVPLAWRLYFPQDDSITKEDPRLPLIHELTRFFRTTGKRFLSNVDFSTTMCAVFSFPELRDAIGIPDFAWGVCERPSETLSCIGVSVFEALFFGPKPGDPSDYVDIPGNPVLIRLVGYEPTTPLRFVKSNLIGRFVCVTGTVVRVSTIKPLLHKMKFICSKCNSEVWSLCPDGKLEPPVACTSSHCRSRSLIADKSTAVTVDWQKIRLQEIIDDENREEGRMPRTIECELTQDLVDQCVPGDEISVCGIVKFMSTDAESATGRAGKNKCLFLLYIDANSISKSAHSSKKISSRLESSATSVFSAKELAGIKEIAYQPNLFRLLVNSLCPSIFGNELVKAAMILSLFGGNPRFATDKSKLSIRGDIHVLIVGDPGLGKSQLLQGLSAIAPRGVYVCGNSTSTAGLTVTVVKDSITGDFALEAGALVLSDQGICCVDEFDKMGGEQQALLEAMEQQTISIAKAGIVCSLSARAAIVAAANPVGGHYNRAKTVAENLKLPRPILSRFDIIFVLLDKPDNEKDRLLSEHVMTLHSTSAKASSNMRYLPMVTPWCVFSRVTQRNWHRHEQLPLCRSQRT